MIFPNISLTSCCMTTVVVIIMATILLDLVDACLGTFFLADQKGITHSNEIVSDEQDWIDYIHKLLLRTSSAELGISESVRQELLREDSSTWPNQGPVDQAYDFPERCRHQPLQLPFRGLPRRPLHKDLARRLRFLSRKQAHTVRAKSLSTRIVGSQSVMTSKRQQTRSPLVPAEVLDLAELPQSIPRVPKQMGEIKSWLNLGGDDAVAHILGIRRSVGSIPASLALSFPTEEQLLKAAQEPYNSKRSQLSVCARARAKHAHRGGLQGSFFGQVLGGELQQNQASLVVVEKIMNDCVWINVHTFAGTNDEPCLELRVENGYGARWMIFKASDAGDDESSSLSRHRVEFRGFLEPQMKDGHLKRWRHS